MTFNLTFDHLEGDLQAAAGHLQNQPTLRRQVLGAMAAKFKMLCYENLGASGTDRPSEWNLLSPKYAKRVGRDYATLDLTGNLMRSIRVNVNDDYAEVYVDSDQCPYAARHQWGDENMPARPFFPMTESGITPRAQEQVIEAASEMFAQGLSGKTYIGPIY